MKNKGNHTFALTLLVSILVFIIIAVALSLAVAILYILLAINAIDSIDSRFELHDIVILMSVISMVIGFILTIITSKFSLKPFNRIINQLDRLAKGDFKARIEFSKPIGYHPTFKNIEDNFNRAAKELEQTEMLRKDFINNFSHEFKTPIVSIAGFAKLVRHGNLTEEQKNEYLEVIEEESMRLSYMATNVLCLTKVENQNILTEVTSFNLSEQIRSCVLLLIDKWTSKLVEMELNFREHSICANEELLKQIWINLIDNAIKFSDQKDKITINIKEDNRKIHVCVSNRGEIPKEAMPRIFNKFYQADESHTVEGNGIGLAIVKKVVELHNGEIKAESADDIVSFTVTLPKFQ
ncbi:MAG: HAMP domain-containing histidine kinase [Ruminococcaceae bacterium]|nr:HAMP domain-containing histidine kinase [Oscillospiraceae bacterium]